MNANDLLEHMDILYKSALIQTRDEDMAKDLVQETYLYALQALEKNVDIINPRAYLLSVLRNRFYMFLRKKYQLPTVYFGDLPFELSKETDFEKLERLEEAEAVRRELAFLSQTYREVMVLYYMKNESVEQIATALSLPKGTVLSRLDIGRKKIKEGIENMDTSYTENSYRPEILTLGMNGRCGKSGEPFSCMKNLLDQNILITAYEKPLTASEIARSLGTAMAFIEESVENLVNAQLMKREGTKVATDFFIISLENQIKASEVAKAFAKKSFAGANAVIMKAVERYENIAGFSAFNLTQKYLCAVLSMRLAVNWRIQEAITGKESLDFKDYPDRPNYGKWVVMGNRYPHGYQFNDTQKYNISGRSGVDGINEYIQSSCEWNSALGPTHWAKYKYQLSHCERAQLIDAVRTNTVNAFQIELLPDMQKYGFIKEEGGAKVPAVPYITREEEKTFFEIEGESGRAFCDCCLDGAVKICKDNKIAYPRHIPFADEYAYTLPLDFLPMAYVYEAAEHGIVSIEEGKYYPVMYFVKK